MLRLSRFLSSAVFLLAAALLLAAGPRPAAAQQPGDIPRVDYDVRSFTYPDLRSFDAPEPERIELDNGMTIFLLEDSELPTVNAVARIGIGSVYEPAEKRGLASMTGSVMRTGGTESMPADSINALIESVGATVETGIGETSGSAFMSTLSDNVDRVLPVFADVLREPAFAEDKVQLAKRRQRSAISRRNDSPQGIATRVMDKVIYGEESPYARTAELYTVDRVQRQDLVDFHERYVHPNNVILSVWGDFEADAMEERLREQFGDWERPSDFEPPTPPAPEAQLEASVNLVPKQDVNQSTVLIGHAGEITKQSDDYTAVTMMNQVLSGGFSSRLFQNVRREQGLAYSVFGSYSTGYTRPGRFFAGILTQSSTTVEGTRAVMEEVEKMRETPPTDEELQLAKDSYLNSFVFNFDTEREVLGRLMTYEAYGYPSDFLEQTRQGIEAVTPADVQRVAEDYLHPDRAHVLVVGRPADFSQSLSTLAEGGAVDTVDISIPQRPPQEEASPADREAMASGMKALRSAREALGGSAFDQVENMRVVTERGGNSNTLVVSLPDRVRAEQSTPQGTMTVVSDGQSIKMQMGGRTRTLPASARGQVLGQLWRSVPYLMVNLEEEGLSAEATGTETVDGTEYRTVEVSPPVGSAFTLYLNPDTMRPARLKSDVQGQQGTVTVVQEFSDYRSVSGVTVPFQQVVYQNGSKAGEATVQSFEVNTTLEDGLFTIGSGSGEGSASGE
jgi:predicted Zn-dependent peptidase